MPPVRKRRTGLWIGLAGGLAALAILCGVGVFYTIQLGSIVPTISAPERVDVFNKVTDNPGLEQLAQQVGDKIKVGTNAGDAVSAFYQDPAAPEALVAIIAVATMITDPKRELDDALAGVASNGEFPITGIRDYPTGSLGGYVRCGTGKASGIDVAVCGWSDGGSLGVGMFFFRGVAASAPLFLQFREAVEKR